MKKIILIFAVAIIIASLLLFTSKPARQTVNTTITENSDVTDVADKIAGIENTGDEDAIIENLGVENIGTADDRNAFERKFTHIIKESLATSNSWVGPLVRRKEDGTWERYIHTNTEPKIIRIDSDALEVVEYARIARASTSLSIPDDAAYTAEIQGDTIVVTFHKPMDEEYFHFRAFMDIKTKKVLLREIPAD